MRTLDRYIVRNFLESVLLWFLVLMALRMVTDLFVNMDEFAKLGKPFGQMVGDIATYYGYQSVVYFVELGGVILVAGAAFSLARMNHTNELTAMLASGVSLHRVVWPIVLCAMGMGAMIIIDQEFVIPSVASGLARSRDDAPGTKEFQVRLIADGSGASWYSPRFSPLDKAMESPQVHLRDKRGRMLGRIVGTRARAKDLDGVPGWMLWDARLVPESDQPASDTAKIHTSVGPQALLDNALKPRTEPDKPTTRASAREDPNGIAKILDAGGDDASNWMRIRAESLELEPAVPGEPRRGVLRKPRFTFRAEDGAVLCTILADSASWRGGDLAGARWELNDGVLFIPSDLNPEDLKLRQHSRWLDYMSTGQLTAYLKLDRVSDRGSAELIRQARVADPVNNLVMLLLGLPFILSRERNIKASAGLCLLMVGAYYAFIYICRYMNLPPAWAAWLPILLFGPVAAVMFDSVKT